MKGYIIGFGCAGVSSRNRNAFLNRGAANPLFVVQFVVDIEQKWAYNE